MLLFLGFWREKFFGLFRVSVVTLNVFCPNTKEGKNARNIPLFQSSRELEPFSVLFSLRTTEERH